MTDRATATFSRVIGKPSGLDEAKSWLKGNSSSAADSLKAKEAEYKKLQEAYNEISKKMGSLGFEIQELKKVSK